MPHISFDSLPLLVNPCYYKYIFDRRRYNIFYGGAGSGKSHFKGQRVVYRLVAEPGHNYLILRKVAKTSRYSTFALIKQIINAWFIPVIRDDLFKINETDMTITCNLTGNQIIFAGLDDVEKLKSITFQNGPLTDIWIEETTETEKQEILQLDLRLRGQARQPFQMSLSFNPIAATHWLKSEFFDKPRPSDKILILKTTYKDNNFLDADYRDVLESLKTTDRAYYDVYCMGNWGVYGDLVFQNYVIEDFDRSQWFDRVFFGVDVGYNHNYAVVKIGMRPDSDDLYILDEIYVREHTTREVIALNEQLGIIDKSLPGTADSADPASIREWQDAGYNVKPAKKGRDSRRAGYSYLRSRKLHIHSSCVGFRAEVESLAFKQNKEGNSLDEPVEFKDDAIAAARYATEHLWQKSGIAFAKLPGIGV